MQGGHRRAPISLANLTHQINIAWICFEIVMQAIYSEHRFLFCLALYFVLVQVFVFRFCLPLNSVSAPPHGRAGRRRSTEPHDHAR